MSDNKKIISNEADIIDFNRILDAFNRRKKFFFKILGTFFFISCVNTFYDMSFNKVYKGSFSLLISDPLSDQKNQKTDLVSQFQNLALNNTNTDIPTLIILLKSEVYLNSVAKKYGVSSSSIANRLFIKVGSSAQNKSRASRYDRAEGILKVEITSKDKKRDIKLLNDLSKSYLESSYTSRKQKLNDGLDFLGQQEPILKDKLNKIQQELVEFRKNNSLIEPELEGKAIKEQQFELEKKLGELIANNERLISARKDIQNNSLSANSFQEIIGTVASGGLIVTEKDEGLLSQLSKIEEELAIARTKYSKNSTIIRGLENREKEIRPYLKNNQLKNVDTALKINNTKINSLKNQLLNIQDKFINQPGLIKKYNVLQQSLKIASDNLNGLASARENFQLQIAQSTVPWKIIEFPKIGSKPIKPDITERTIIGFLLSFIVGTISVYIREVLDNTYKTATDLQNNLNLPLLADIPYLEQLTDVKSNKKDVKTLVEFKNNDKDLTKDEQFIKFVYQEALRNICTSIKFSNTKKGLKKLLITSSVPSEGKSLLNILVGKTLSELDYKVLLIDVDLRKPRLHTYLGINNILGVSNFVTETNLDLKTIIQRSPTYENVDILTAGSKVPNPTRIINSRSFDNLIDNITKNEKYDYILFDAPPLLGMSETQIIAKKVDGIVLLCNLNIVKRGFPTQSLNKLQSYNINLIGLVINNLKMDNAKRSNNYYSSYSKNNNYSYVASQIYGNYIKNENSDTEDNEENSKNKVLTFLINFSSLLKENSKKFINWLDN